MPARLKNMKALADMVGGANQLSLMLGDKPMVKSVPAAKLAKKQTSGTKKPRVDYADLFVAQMKRVAPELVPVGKHSPATRNEYQLQAEQALTEFVFENVAEKRWRFDIAWPIPRVAVEVDGGRWASGGGRHATDGDKDKMNKACREGWIVLHFSKDMILKTPDDVVADIKATLAQRGIRI